MSTESSELFCNFSVREKFKTVSCFKPINETLNLNGREVFIHIEHPFTERICPNLGYVVAFRFLLSNGSTETWEIIESRIQMILRLLGSPGVLVLDPQARINKLWDGDIAILNFASEQVRPGIRSIKENDISLNDSVVKSELFQSPEQIVHALKQLKQSFENPISTVNKTFTQR